MSGSHSDYEQQIFGTTANAIGLATMLGQLVQLGSYLSAKSKPNPKKALAQVQKELDSFHVLLDREKHIVTGKTLEGFEREYMRIQIRIQKETDRIKASQGTKSERRESLENIQRISGNIQKVRKDFVSSSANARNMRSASTIHIEVCDPVVPKTSGGLASVSQKVLNMCYPSKVESSVVPMHADPNVSLAGESSQPALGAQKADEFYFEYVQTDGTVRLVHSEELKNDPTIAPELVNALMRAAEAQQQGAAVTLASSPSVRSTQRESNTGNVDGRNVPIYKISLDLVPEVVDA